MTLIEWTRDLEIGEASVDAEHRGLADLVNELHAAMQRGHGRRVLASVIERLQRYAEQHFANEERIMRETGFPGIEAHVAEHRRFTEQVRHYAEDLGSTRPHLVIEVQSYLHRWLLDHIRRSDRELIPYIARARAAVRRPD